MNKITFKQAAIALCFICALMIFITFKSFAQDTIRVNKVRVANALIDKKTGWVIKVWYRKIKVKSGYIIRQTNGLYAINDKEMKLSK